MHLLFTLVHFLFWQPGREGGQYTTRQIPIISKLPDSIGRTFLTVAQHLYSVYLFCYCNIFVSTYFSCLRVFILTPKHHSSNIYWIFRKPGNEDENSECNAIQQWRNPEVFDSTGWDCRIHRLHLCREVRLPQWVSWLWHYGVTPVMLELWGMRCTAL